MSSPASVAESPLLAMRGIEKSFPGVRALGGVDLRLERGEVLALLGENGAGKSTLIKMLGGAHLPDMGSICIEGVEMQFSSPIEANKAGIGIIYQEFNLIPELSVWENIFLGREASFGLVRRSEERHRANELFEQIGVSIPIDVPCSELSVAQQQIVEIAKALSQDVRLIVMDEPSAALTPQEVSRLFDIIRDLKQNGIGVIYISHRLDEIFEISDRVVILRDGEVVGEAATDQLTRKRMIELMVGREISNEFPKHYHQIGKARLAVEGLNRAETVRDVSFEIHAGEVLGLTGLVGAGRTETARIIFGADQADSGTILLDGEMLEIHSPRHAIQAGICLLTEDRKSQGLILDLSVRENFGLPNLNAFSKWGCVNQKKERITFADYVSRLSIKIPHQEQLARSLSGGNQQKVVLAKWMEKNAEVVIFDEPTRGIDVGAKYEIYTLINELASQGKAILMISSELPEVMGMSDRILVMHQGRITGEIRDVANTTQEEIMKLAVI
ncbi:sugar ABC transporter ATP-binding protein [Gimesia aquarii]|uniref:Ribose import ATP-binding protein RbsA n=1 Tax=Gimesia aquarii TaxID=2527964 RepID=A0A517VZK2_9PLAN|nr:sugar ABC transporter ATP-binding protein [Gimesia aquarii]QDT98431.1 Ribose import ATP-binding protein RbsA [Gimesia aquarii]